MIRTGALRPFLVLAALCAACILGAPISGHAGGIIIDGCPDPQTGTDPAFLGADLAENDSGDSNEPTAGSSNDDHDDDGDSDSDSDEDSLNPWEEEPSEPADASTYSSSDSDTQQLIFLWVAALLHMHSQTEAQNPSTSATSAALQSHGGSHANSGCQQAEGAPLAPLVITGLALGLWLRGNRRRRRTSGSQP